MDDDRRGGAAPAPFAISAPSIALPKGGGAIRGIGEKLAANPVTGTASFSIPIATSPARGFGPTLALAYDSGSGNGPFGFGWTLGLANITRKTDKGLPRYRDAEESDVFVVSGAEDLVAMDAIERMADGYRVRRYRPRVEGGFARIERWTKAGDVHWRTTSADNVTTIYGASDASRIFDPEDRSRIFAWLPSESYDGKGNAIVYVYSAEDGAGVDATQIHERNRTNRTAARYLERIRYGNREMQRGPADPAPATWMFEVVFDYDEGRPDPFSSYRAGFEVRTYRRCRRVRMLHRFTELGTEPYLVRSTELEYDDLDYSASPSIEAELAHPGSTRIGSHLRRVAQRGYLRNDDGSYTSQSLPPIELTYSRPVIDETVRTLDAANLPLGLDGARYRWIDLDGEGVNGVLAVQGGGWFYKRNRGASELGEVELLPTIPAALDYQLLDLAGSGRLDVVELGGVAPGYYERTADRGWDAFVPFTSLPRPAATDPAGRLVDLTGDGLADLLCSDPDGFVWYPSLGREGFAPGERVVHDRDEERAPHLMLADTTQAIYLADMSGDGLTDLVRVRNGEVCYWPNLGYGRFGAKVTMDRSPLLDAPERFDQRRVRLVDLDGSGTTDLVYLGHDSVALYFNQAGNGFTAARVLGAVPRFDDLSSVMALDLLGSGTGCLVWSSPLPSRPTQYVDLLSAGKPNLLVGVDNNLGARTEIRYAPSTRFYLDDARAGTPWLTRLPFTVHCVERITVRDRWRGSTFSTTYSYHHGYFDGVERELRGFARVEQLDAEDFGTFAAGNRASPFITQDQALYQPPIKTVTWFHTGADVAPLAREFYRPAGERELTLLELPAGADVEDRREALRAVKGNPIRREVYELDVDALATTGAHVPVRLVSTAFHNHAVQRLQARGANRHAVFLVGEIESLSYQYELDLRGTTPPDPRIAHTANLAIDGYGNVVQAVAVGYPRRGTYVDPTLPPGTEATIQRVQRELHVAYTERRFTNAIDDATGYRTPAPSETLTYELTGIAPPGDYFALGELRALDLSDAYPPRATPAVPVAPLAYHQLASTGRERRLVEHERTLYCDDTLVAPRPLGQIDALGLTYEHYKLASTDALLTAVFGAKLVPAVRTALASPARSGYLASGNELWARSGRVEVDPARFYLPVAYVDGFEQRTELTYVADLVVASARDPLSNVTTVTAIDFRVLAPSQIEDPNGNLSDAAFDILGVTIATAVRAAGDRIAGLAERPAFFTAPYDPADARAMLGDATTRHVYSHGERMEADGSITWGVMPACAATIARERHAVANSPLHVVFAYSDGSGNVLVEKQQAEPAPGSTALRWIASGKTVVNNKGKPVMQYEPYFSSNEHRFEELVAVGVTAVLYYDALDRVIRTEAPDGSYTRVEQSPWHVARFDPNDTVGEPENAWYATHATGSAEEQRAAAATLLHTDTPAVTFLDSLGREVIAVAAPSQTETYVTVTHLDAEGKPLWVRDPRGNLVVQYIQPAMADGSVVDATAGFTPSYDIAGNALFQHGMDAGDAWTLNDASGKALFAWTTNERDGVQEDRFVDARYDALHRPTEVWLTTNGQSPELVERRTYGEGVVDDRARNLRGRLFEHDDPSGRITNVRYDFAGRAVEIARTLVADYATPRIDWQTATLGPETFTRLTAFDALGRITRLDDWHVANGRVAVFEPTYNERGLLAAEQLTVGGVRTTVLDELVYDAKGQRQAIRHGNGTRTRYTYDPLTFRLVQMRTTRPGYDPVFPSAVAQFRDPAVVQNLFYTYDPAGNVTEIYDDAFRPAFFANQQVEAAARYTYDALYRLIAATGREHAAALMPDATEPAPLATAFPVPTGDPADQRNYREQYAYDAAGNLTQIAHAATTSWTRNLAYEDHSNRLRQTWTGTDTLNAIAYAHDSHGNVLALGQPLIWDHRDQIQVVDRGGGGRVYYHYDADKQRTRKVAVNRAGAKTWERIYLGGMEIYRRYGAGGVVIEETESHHVVDGERRVLLVENVIVTDRGAPGRLYRYQYANHLGSSCLELDDGAAVITYEEFHPYGTTSYRSARNATEAAKRYRFTGMERDDESGLSYHTARYYVPWLGRWCSPDPAGLVDGPNVYLAMGANPLRNIDQTGSQSEDKTKSRNMSVEQAGIASYIQLVSEVKPGMMSTAARADVGAYWKYHGKLGAQRAQFLADYLAEQPGVKEVFRESTSKVPVTDAKGRVKIKTATDLGGPTTDPDSLLKKRQHDIVLQSEAAPTKGSTVEVSNWDSFERQSKVDQMGRSAESVHRKMLVGNSETGFLEHAADIPQDAILPKNGKPAPGWSDPNTGLKIEPIPPEAVPANLFENVPEAPPSAKGTAIRSNLAWMEGAGFALGVVGVYAQITQNTPEVPVMTDTGAQADYDSDVLEWTLGLREKKPASVVYVENKLAKEAAARELEIAKRRKEDERIQSLQAGGFSNSN